ncbi:MAG: tRNA (adenosine(37)-N6)-threonylcarbamoyltransferase complex transferase subunit TsaD [Treponema sp.]|jgi:N6-L-threonylcarbamoyladenine synthase|nr:tRNA (adenosine(37)-N6)-threonylcarbamoyltransferase complex transferase subunit TsaD [Treponema sp.]
MRVLGIESSCDECAASVVEDGRWVLSNVVATQIPFHAVFDGVVPEIASRKHTEWIYGVVKEALDRAGLGPADLDGVAAVSRPGLLGSLLVGLSFAKGFAWARGLPFIAVNHMLAHLYASRLEDLPALQHTQGSGPAGEPEIPAGASPAPGYPFLGLLVSGGHSIICRVDDFDDITVLGATIDDAVGEAFDKVSKFYGFGYPGGAAIDKLAQAGNPDAFRFPLPNLHKGQHPYDMSYSGLKTAVINQLDRFRSRGGRAPGGNGEGADIAASFQKTAIEILLRSLLRAVHDTGLNTIVAGGGVAANSYLRARLAGLGASPEAGGSLRCVFPPARLCGDNGAMVAGIGCRYLERGETSPFTVSASARVEGFKRKYP